MPAHVSPRPALAMLRAALLAVALVAAWILLQTAVPSRSQATAGAGLDAEPPHPGRTGHLET